MSRTVKISLHNNLDLTPLDNPLSGLTLEFYDLSCLVKNTLNPHLPRPDLRSKIHVVCIYTVFTAGYSVSFINRNCLCLSILFFYILS